MIIDKKQEGVLYLIAEGGRTMDLEERKRMERLEEIAKQDLHYQVLMQELRAMEKEYDMVLRCLDDRQRNAVCDFVSQCEEISFHMLELACRYMRFP